MNNDVLLKITGEVEKPLELTFADLAAIPQDHQLTNVIGITKKYPGDAIKMSGLLEWVGLKSIATHIGLHGSADDFHASIPLAPVLEKAILIDRLDGQPLNIQNGGPTRFFFPDHAACHVDEIDECANVKFLDHIELTIGKGFDNRPHDDAQHEALHRKEQQ